MPLSKRESEWNYRSVGYSRGYNQRIVADNRVQNRAYVHTPNNLTQISQYKQKKAQNRRKLNKKGVFALFLIVLLFVGFVTPFFLRNVTKNILFGMPSNSQIKIDNYNYLYQPVTKYLYNTDFMNTHLLIGAAKKPLMQSVYTTKELVGLKKELQNLLAGYSKLDAGIFVWDTSNGNFVDINSEKIFPAASVIKIPVLISLFKAIEEGKLKKTDKISLENYYRSPGSGSLQYKAEGLSLTVDDLARLMITESDNSSTNILMSIIGSMTAVNDDIKRWGLKNTHINTWLPDLNGTNYTTPKDLAVMLHNLDNEAFLTLESRVDIFDYMGNVKNNRLLAAGLPGDASIAHKTGDIGSMLGDAGIIYSPNGRKYIVAILVKRPHNNYAAKGLIVNASRIIYNYMTSY